MFDRSGFWSPPPDWRHARLEATDVAVAVAAPQPAWRLSGRGVPAMLQACGAGPAIGPREPVDAPCYALRIAPDSVLLVCDAALSDTVSRGVHPEVFASEVGDGLVRIDITGPAAPVLLSLASEYPFTDPPGSPLESTRMLFASLRVMLARRSDGWRLHVELSWAPALWRWLAAQIDWMSLQTPRPVVDDPAAAVIAETQAGKPV